MKCVVSGNNVKILGRTMHCLSKIGDEIYLDPGGDGLGLVAYNTSKSAFIRFFFNVSFFESYNSGGKMSEYCVCIKGILMAFKSLFLIEKTVESCRLEMLEDDLKITLFCKHSVKKSYVLPFMDFEAVQSLRLDTSGANQFVVKAQTFSEAVINFLINQEEVTMYVDESRFLMKNYHEIDPNQSVPIKKSKNKTKIEANSVYTELTLKPEEFEDYSIDHACELTFCLRELRPFIAFAESLSCPVSVYFDQGGSPITFEVDGHLTFESKIVLSTSQHGTSSSDEGDHGSLPGVLSQKSTSMCAPQSQSTLNGTLNMKRKSSTPLLSTVSESATPECTPIPNFGHPIIPKSPPAKKMKYFFKKCFNKTFNPNNVTGAQIVLAPDSDDDGDEDNET